MDSAQVLAPKPHCHAADADAKHRAVRFEHLYAGDSHAGPLHVACLHVADVDAGVVGAVDAAGVGPCCAARFVAGLAAFAAGGHHHHLAAYSSQFQKAPVAAVESERAFAGVVVAAAAVGNSCSC